MDIIRIESQPFSPLSELEQFQQSYLYGDVNYGAMSSFIGTMRDINEGDEVTSMHLEHYPKMTTRQLKQLIAETHQQWPVLHSLIIHRVGRIEPGEPIVLVAVWSAHRQAAFKSVHYLMESLKTLAPFWKKEELQDGSSRWVEKNTTG